MEKKKKILWVLISLLILSLAVNALLVYNSVAPNAPINCWDWFH